LLTKIVQKLKLKDVKTKNVQNEREILGTYSNFGIQKIYSNFGIQKI
jgi:hypothetical protein